MLRIPIKWFGGCNVFCAGGNTWSPSGEGLLAQAGRLKARCARPVPAHHTLHAALDTAFYILLNMLQ
jgi:hypothetical protein